MDASDRTPLITRFRAALVRLTGRKPSALAGLGRAAEIDAFGRSAEPVDDPDAGRDEYEPAADTPWELREGDLRDGDLWNGDPRGDEGFSRSPR
ncbi:hypothetical protein ACUWEX_05615 [Okibacterium fritillariae]|uniref:hypothetical protein n=1 Tax=Okibacterium fritillariae TaxID=123320 RepID=UPI0040556A88